MTSDLSIDTLLGANTPAGFHSFYDDFINTAKNVYIVKGGPGTGKSSFMKKVNKAALSKGYHTELIHCSSDPDSLDGVRIDELDTVFADGTPPHTLEPPFPGAVGSIINLGDFWDSRILKDFKHDIIDLNTKIKLCFERAYRFLGAVGKLNNDLFITVYECAETLKIEKYIQNEIHKLKGKFKGKGIETKRFLSGFTPEGFTFYPETLFKSNCEISIISDDFGISPLIIKKIRNCALELGFDVASFYSPLDPENSIEHLLIPSAGIGYATSNRYHFIKTQPYGRIRIERFIDMEKLRKRKVRIEFLKKVKYELLCEAVESIKKSKALHDELEKYYIKSMDFVGMNSQQDKNIEKIVV